MGQTSFLKNKVLYSPLASQSTLRPSRSKKVKSQGATLMLTSLVDAFSILVIFLMMNSATESSDFESKNVQLPKATQAATTLKTTVVRLKGQDYFINEKAIRRQDLAKELGQIHQQLKASNSTAAESLVIIADRDVDFQTLNPIMVSGSRVGFSEFKFAVEKQVKNQ